MTVRVGLLYVTAAFLLIHVTGSQIIPALISPVPKVPSTAGQNLKTRQQLTKAANGAGLPAQQTKKIVGGTALPTKSPVQKIPTTAVKPKGLLPAKKLAIGATLKPPIPPTLLHRTAPIARASPLKIRSANNDEITAINPFNEASDNEYKQVIGSSGSLSNDTTSQSHQAKIRSPGDDLDYLSKAANPDDDIESMFQRVGQELKQEMSNQKSSSDSESISVVPFRFWATSYMHQHPDTALTIKDLMRMYKKMLDESDGRNGQSSQSENSMDEFWNSAIELIQTEAKNARISIDINEFKSWAKQYLTDNSEDHTLTIKDLTTKYLSIVTNSRNSESHGSIESSMIGSVQDMSEFHNKQTDSMENNWRSGSQSKTEGNHADLSVDTNQFKSWAQQYLREHPNDSLTMKDLTNIYMSTLNKGNNHRGPSDAVVGSSADVSAFQKSITESSSSKSEKSMTHSESSSSQNYENQQFNSAPSLNQGNFNYRPSIQLSESKSEKSESQKSMSESTSSKSEKTIQYTQNNNNNNQNYNDRNQQYSKQDSAAASSQNKQESSMNQFSNSGSTTSNAEQNNMQVTIDSIPFNNWAQQYTSEHRGEYTVKELLQIYSSYLNQNSEQSHYIQQNTGQIECDRSQNQPTHSMLHAWNSGSQLTDNFANTKSQYEANRNEQNSQNQQSQSMDHIWNSGSQLTDNFANTQSQYEANRNEQNSQNQQSQSTDYIWNSGSQLTDNFANIKSQFDTNRNEQNSQSQQSQSMDRLWNSGSQLANNFANTKSQYEANRNEQNSQNQQSQSMDRIWNSGTKISDNFANTKSQFESSKNEQSSQNQQSQSIDRTWNSGTKLNNNFANSKSQFESSNNEQSSQNHQSQSVDRIWNSGTKLNNNFANSKSQYEANRNEQSSQKQQTQSIDRIWNSGSKLTDNFANTKSQFGANRNEQSSQSQQSQSLDRVWNSGSKLIENFANTKSQFGANKNEQSFTNNQNNKYWQNSGSQTSNSKYSDCEQTFGLNNQMSISNKGGQINPNQASNSFGNFGNTAAKGENYDQNGQKLNFNQKLPISTGNIGGFIKNSNQAPIFFGSFANAASKTGDCDENGQSLNYNQKLSGTSGNIGGSIINPNQAPKYFTNFANAASKTGGFEESGKPLNYNQKLSGTSGNMGGSTINPSQAPKYFTNFANTASKTGDCDENGQPLNFNKKIPGTTGSNGAFKINSNQGPKFFTNLANAASNTKDCDENGQPLSYNQKISGATGSNGAFKINSNQGPKLFTNLANAASNTKDCDENGQPLSYNQKISGATGNVAGSMTNSERNQFQGYINVGQNSQGSQQTFNPIIWNTASSNGKEARFEMYPNGYFNVQQIPQSASTSSFLSTGADSGSAYTGTNSEFHINSQSPEILFTMSQYPSLQSGVTFNPVNNGNPSGLSSSFESSFSSKGSSGTVENGQFDIRIGPLIKRSEPNGNIWDSATGLASNILKVATTNPRNFNAEQVIGSTNTIFNSAQNLAGNIGNLVTYPTSVNNGNNEKLVGTSNEGKVSNSIMNSASLLSSNIAKIATNPLIASRQSVGSNGSFGSVSNQAIDLAGQIVNTALISRSQSSSAQYANESYPKNKPSESVINSAAQLASRILNTAVSDPTKNVVT